MLGARDDGEGAARRRRERRLRSWLRHERQSVAVALSEYMHHSSRAQRKDRAGEEGHEDKHDAPRRQKPPPPQPGECVPGGFRPPCLGGGTGTSTVEQLADVVPVVQILDLPVPQKVEQLADFLLLLDTQTPVEQVKDVSMIPQDFVPQLCGP